MAHNNTQRIAQVKPRRIAWRDIIAAMPTAGDRLRRARIAAGYRTVADAAEAFGWKEAAARHHENGTRQYYDIKAALRYARAFRVDVNSLLGTASETAPVQSPTAEQFAQIAEIALKQVAPGLAVKPAVLQALGEALAGTVQEYLTSPEVSNDPAQLRTVARTLARRTGPQRLQ